MPIDRKRPAAPRRLLPLFAGLAAFCLAQSALAQSAAALTLSFPAPDTVTASRAEALTSYRLPVGPWTPAGITTKLTEGPLEQGAWRIDGPGLTTLQLLRPLREQLTQAGYRVIFECETDVCGGFDFRYGTDILPEPDMHVDLGDFRYLAAERPTSNGTEALSLLVSRSATAGFVQLTRIGAPPEVPLVTASTKSPEPEAPLATSGLGARLETGGAQALEDLVFASSSAELVEGDYPSLVELAAYLTANPARNVTVVGHTDASGALAGNLVLSKQRAQSVRNRLVGLGVPATQVSADGVGYLVPRDSNLTEEGRTRNRRVEVMLTSTQ